MPSPADLYPDGDGAFEFERTVSRLMEMQSADYLALGPRRGIDGGAQLRRQIEMRLAENQVRMRHVGTVAALRANRS